MDFMSTLPKTNAFRLKRNSQKKMATLDNKYQNKFTEPDKIKVKSKNPYFQEYMQTLRSNISPLLFLRQMQQTKIQENYQDIGRIGQENRRIAQQNIKAIQADKSISSNVEGASLKIQKLQNSTNKVGLAYLKKLCISFTKQKYYLQKNYLIASDNWFRRDQIVDNEKLKDVICKYIDQNKKFFNKEVVRIENYERTAPFKLEQMQFIQKFLPQCLIVNKEFGYDEDNLKRNNLTLEKIILERIIIDERNKAINQ